TGRGGPHVRGPVGDRRAESAEGALPHHGGTGAPVPDARRAAAVRPGDRRTHRGEPPDRPALPEAAGAHRTGHADPEVRGRGPPGTPLRVGGPRLRARSVGAGEGTVPSPAYASRRRPSRPAPGRARGPLHGARSGQGPHLGLRVAGLVRCVTG